MSTRGTMVEYNIILAVSAESIAARRTDRGRMNGVCNTLRALVGGGDEPGELVLLRCLQGGNSGVLFCPIANF